MALPGGGIYSVPLTTPSSSTTGGGAAAGGANNNETLSLTSPQPDHEILSQGSGTNAGKEQIRAKYDKKYPIFVAVFN